MWQYAVACSVLCCSPPTLKQSDNDSALTCVLFHLVTRRWKVVYSLSAEFSFEQCGQLVLQQNVAASSV